MPDQVRGDGVLDHADGDQGGAVDAGVEDQAGVEVVGRQRRQVWEFGVVVLPDRVGVAGDAAGVVIVFPGADLVVEFVQVATSGIGVRWLRRNQPTSPSTPPFSWAPSMPG